MHYPNSVCQKSVLDDFKYRHLDLRRKFRPNTHIGAIGIDDLFRDGYKAIS